MFSCKLNMFSKGLLTWMILILPGFSLAEPMSPRRHHPFHDKVWHGELEYEYFASGKKDIQTANCRLTLFRTPEWTQIQLDPKTKKTTYRPENKKADY